MYSNKKILLLAGSVLLLISILGSASQSAKKGKYRVMDLALEGDILWLATSEGMIKLDTKEESYKLLYSSSENEYLKRDYGFTAVTIDKKGSKWFGTGNKGVFRYQGGDWEQFTVQDGLADDRVISAATDKQGNVWLGTFNGVSRYDGKKWTTYDTTNGLANSYVKAIAFDKMGRHWFGTMGGGVCCYDGKQWANYDTTKGLASNVVFAIHIDKRDQLWFGTEAGVSVYNGKKWDTITTKDGLAFNSVLSIAAGPRKTMWFGTGGYIYLFSDETRGGLSRKEGKRWTTFTSWNDGLASSTICDIVIDKRGIVWLATVRGLSRYDGKFKNYFTEVEESGLGEVQDLLGDTKPDAGLGLDLLLDSTKGFADSVLENPGSVFE